MDKSLNDCLSTSKSFKRMKNCKKHFIVALIVLFSGQFLAKNDAHAQVMEVGGSIGLSYYMGDVNPNIPFNQSALGWGALVRYYEGTRWAFRLAYSNLQLNGSDKASGYRPERGLSFNTNVHDVALLAEFNFFDYFTGSRRNRFTPYLFGGISVLYFNPKDDNGTELYNVLTDVDDYIDDDNNIVNGQEKYSRASVSLPFGVGVKYSVSNRIGMALEWRWHYAFTDWLDDCHAYYPIFNASDKKYVQRGNKSDNDWYGYLNLSITYKFNLPTGDGCNKKERYKNYD